MATDGGKSGRDARLAAALRANLRRRKAAVADAPTTTDDAPDRAPRPAG